MTKLIKIFSFSVLIAFISSSAIAYDNFDSESSLPGILDRMIEDDNKPSLPKQELQVLSKKAPQEFNIQAEIASTKTESNIIAKKIDINDLFMQEHKTYTPPPELIAKKNLGNKNEHLPEIKYPTYFYSLSFESLKRNHINEVSYFINRFNMQNIADMDGNTMLHHAVKDSQHDLTRVLLHKNFEINKQNIYEKTPLHLACQNNDTEMVKILLTMEAKTNIKDHNYHTALDIAQKNDSLDIIKLLKTYKKQ